MKAGDQFGPSVLEEDIGGGGNGVVWRARHAESGDTAAVKFINATKADREPYKRFVLEIETQAGVDDPGVMPVLDYYLPDDPSSQHRPWLAMPEAQTVDKALAGKPLPEVVAAVAEVAEALACLEAAPGLGHRDVKPRNLYMLDGRAVVGDFGLIKVPGEQGITEEGRGLGPRRYTAYEIIRHPVNADPHPADVFRSARHSGCWPPSRPTRPRGISLPIRPASRSRACATMRAPRHSTGSSTE